MKKILFILISVYLMIYTVRGQQNNTSGKEILTSIQERKTNRSNSIYTDYPARNVGPVVQGGRITDIAVNENNTKEFEGFIEWVFELVFLICRNESTVSFRNFMAISLGINNNPFAFINFNYMLKVMGVVRSVTSWANME